MSGYDLIVIGAGPGGYVGAIRAAQLGLRTAVIERAHLGGICLNWGCIPTKSLLHSAATLKGIRGAAGLGLSASEPGFDTGAVVARSRKVSAQLNGGVEFLLRKNKVDVIWGAAEIVRPGEIMVRPVEGAAPKGALGAGSYQAAHIMIATGAAPRVLPGLEPDGARIWTYFEAMNPPALPDSLIVVGSGAIGVEFAAFYATLGTKVTLIERLPQILPLEDPDIADVMLKALKKQGIAVLTGAAVDRVEKTGAGVVAHVTDAAGGQQTVAAERLLSAVGVVANAAGLGLDRLGVRMTGGVIAIDADGRTSVPGIYAVGDVAGPPMLAHKAEHEAVRCVEVIAGVNRHGAAHGPVPSCVFGHPQVASVGLTEPAARAAGHELRIGRFPFRGNGKAVVLGEVEGLVKTVFDARTDRLLGAHMIGPDVSELIHGYSLAIALNATGSQLAGVIYPHPTLSEALHESVLAADGRAIHA